MVITQILPISKEKVEITFDNAKQLVLYKGEVRQLGLKEGQTIDESLYSQIYYEIVGKRVRKRAMHLLEKMDRTEWQLRRKLQEGKYPQELIDEAVLYVKSYHYIDDGRYARTYIRLNQERRSIGRLKSDLLSKGISEDIIEQAMEEEHQASQEELIRRLLEKKQYHAETATAKETQKLYRFLLGRGFCSHEIMHVLKG